MGPRFVISRCIRPCGPNAMIRPDGKPDLFHIITSNSLASSERTWKNGKSAAMARILPAVRRYAASRKDSKDEGSRKAIDTASWICGIKTPE
jgi:hypothetical protein